MLKPDEFLRRAIASQLMHFVSEIQDGRIGELAARVCRVEANESGKRSTRMAVAQKGAFALATSCAVVPKAEPDFSPCNVLLRAAMSAK